MQTTQAGRRTFLKTAGSIAASSLAPQIAKSANDRVSIGFIGVGVMGSENLKAAMKQEGVAVSAVCDVYQPHLERAGALARRGGHTPKEMGDFREMLADRKTIKRLDHLLRKQRRRHRREDR